MTVFQKSETTRFDEQSEKRIETKRSNFYAYIFNCA